MKLDRLVLQADGSAAHTELISYTCGPKDATRRVHLQAALHADEQPGTMVLHHLLDRLEAAEREGRLEAEFTVFPSVNPLGIGISALHTPIGRYDLTSGVNHNRRWPDLVTQLASEIEPRLGSSAEANVRLIRTAIAEWIATQVPSSAVQQQRLAVLAAASQADLILDLHCDSDSLIHMFTSPDMPGLTALARRMGAAAVLTAEDSGGGSFDEMLPRLYRELARRHPDRPVPMVESATLEYRGQADVEDHLGRSDAHALYDFFCERGMIADTPRPITTADVPVRPLEATEVVRAPRPGLLAYQVQLGQRVRQGDVVAELIVMDGEAAYRRRIPIRAGTDGIVLSRVLARQVSRGSSIAKIVGEVPLTTRMGGYLLED